MDSFTIEIDAQGIALIQLDVPGKSLNVISHAVIADIATLARRLHDDEGIVGVIIASAKPSGLGAGADLSEMLGDIDHWAKAHTQDQLRQGVAQASAFSASLRALETCGKPVACIAQGVALGGAFELFLAAHYRVAVDDPKLRMGLPEATIGLMPGAGATQRLVRMVGLAAAVPWLLGEAPVTLEGALACGVVGATAPSRDAAIDVARGWITGGGSAVAPWDVKGFAIPHGGAHSRAGYAQFGPLVAAAVGKSGGAAHIGNLLKAVYEGSQIPIDAGLRVESRYFFNTARSPEARARVEAFFASRA
jgi:3-hydroxyacyl-CoA dehydrogenase/enoyl-CoA hydratase/3-hydroxybutyryl-CoA epimerase